MSEYAPYIIVGLIVMVTHFQSGITGFGANALALPFVTMIIGLDRAVPVLVVQAILLSALILGRSRGHVAWRQFGVMMGLVGVGMPLGMWAATVLPERQLRWVLAGFMTLVGVQGLIRAGALEEEIEADHDHPRPTTARAPWWTLLLLPIGGITQGAFACGGPPIVVYAARAISHKTVFRGTLSLLWLVLNSILVIGFVARGRVDLHMLQLNLAYAPGTLLGVWLGNHIHHRINEQVFRRVVYVMLLVGGLVMVWTLLR